MIEFIALLLSLMAILLIAAATIGTGTPPLPTSIKVREAMLSVCPETLPDGSVIYELGSGWGGLCFELARRYSGHQVIGLEISLLPWVFSVVVSRLRRMAGKQENVTFRFENIHKARLEGAGLLVCYLMPGAMARLAKDLPEKLDKGACIVSNTFALPGFEPQADMIVDDRHHSHVYAYRLEIPKSPQ